MTWIEIIHNCPTPDLSAVRQAQAQVGSLWQCDSGSPACEDTWKLRQIKCEPGVRGNVGDFPKWDRLTVNGVDVKNDK